MLSYSILGPRIGRIRRMIVRRIDRIQGNQGSGRSGNGWNTKSFNVFVTRTAVPVRIKFLDYG
jgi:hypothetical protein